MRLAGPAFAVILAAGCTPAPAPVPQRVPVRAAAVPVRAAASAYAAGGFPGEGWYAVGRPADSATGQGKHPPDTYYLTPDTDPVTGAQIQPPTNAFWVNCTGDLNVKIVGPYPLSAAQARDAWFTQYGLP